MTMSEKGMDQQSTVIDVASDRSEGSNLENATENSSSMETDKNMARSETTKLDGELSLKTGIHFYPSTAVMKIGEFKDEDDALKTPTYQSYGLDPTAIFKKVTEDDTKLAPEQNITLFALRVAMIEKSASGIGTLSFVWASTIILGGFASNINPVDFLVVTLILVTEGTRIFSRSRELEWQHLASKSTDSSLTYQNNRGYGNDRLQETYKTAKMFHRNDGVQDSEFRHQATQLRESQAHDSDGSHRHGDDGDHIVDPSEKRTDTFEAEDEDGVHSVSGNPRFRHKSPSPEVAARDQKSLLANLSARNIKRTWSSRFVPMIPGGLSSILTTRGISAVLYWVQFTSALICLVLSCWRLGRQDFNPSSVQKQDTPVNLFTSINIFYTLALTEAMLFLLERGYWEYKINHEQLLVDVTNKAELGDENQDIMKQFFYEVYKKCIEGSVFDGLDMDLVEYSLTLLQTDNTYEQLGGLRVLRKIVDRYDGFSADALRRIGTAPGVVERLVEMLSWRSPHQEEIRKEVAALICRVVRYSKNCFRISSVPGSMEGIVSLLKDPEGINNSIDNGKIDKLCEQTNISIRLDGLRILVALARDQVNLLKIGETRGMVPILVSFIAVKNESRFTKMDATELKIFKKVLRLLATLAAARNVSGTILRPVIARVVSGIANLRDILEFGDTHPQLQWMAIEILTNLALDDTIRRSIGSTGGIIRNLFTLYIRNLDGSGAIFATEENRREEKAVSKRAGDALNLLSIQNQRNCLRMMDLQDRNGKRTFIPALIDLLKEHREQTICAAKVLRSLMEYGSDLQRQEIAECTPRVMRLVMKSTSQKMQEAVVGLAPRVIDVLDEPRYNEVFKDVDSKYLVQKLLRNLDHNSQASSKYPRIRRHSIEFILALVNRDANYLDEFMNKGLEKKLVQTMDTICEAENFVIFSGAEGLTRHTITMEDLLQRALLELRHKTQEREKHQMFNNRQYP